MIGGVIVIIAFIFMSASKPVSSTPEASDELIVNVYSHTGEPEAGFDPLLGWGCGHVNFEPLIQSTLFKSADDGSIINDLATRLLCQP